jgi:hypothetical protein
MVAAAPGAADERRHLEGYSHAMIRIRYIMEYLYRQFIQILICVSDTSCFTEVGKRLIPFGRGELRNAADPRPAAGQRREVEYDDPGESRERIGVQPCPPSKPQAPELPKLRLSTMAGPRRTADIELSPH